MGQPHRARWSARASDQYQGTGRELPPRGRGTPAEPSRATNGGPTLPEGRRENDAKLRALFTEGEIGPAEGTLPAGDAEPVGEGPGFFPNRQKGPVTPPLPMPGPPAGGAGGQRCLREGEEGPSLPAHHHQPGSDQQRGEGESPPAARRSDSGPGAARLKSGGGKEEVQVITEELNR